MKALILNLQIPRYLFSKAVGLFCEGIYDCNLSCLFLGDLPEPHLPGEDWVKIRTAYFGICASDLAGMLERLVERPRFGLIYSPATLRRIFIMSPSGFAANRKAFGASFKSKISEINTSG